MGLIPSTQPLGTHEDFFISVLCHPLGDSLVYGIDCDEGISSSSPVLPQIVAKVLSIAMQM